ncbi:MULTISPECIES: hypothetical protein [unclassified Streptomyces]|uniref:hypothetical protein n=1 Tax=unclassified Streptomyces TaxID=2593676 RepID=UPI001F1BF821|nr:MULTISPECIES: hypothetical protein [unclassified Streptomyces]
MRLLDPVVLRKRHIDAKSHSLLRQARSLPRGPDLVTNGAAAGEYPLGGRR